MNYCGRTADADRSGGHNRKPDQLPLVHEILRNLFLRIIPRDQLQFQLSIMMNVLHGWILHMRNRNEFFAVDQLVSHAEALMRVVDGLGHLPSRSSTGRRS